MQPVKLMVCAINKTQPLKKSKHSPYPSTLSLVKGNLKHKIILKKSRPHILAYSLNTLTSGHRPKAIGQRAEA